jgi:hypothetical protein
MWGKRNLIHCWWENKLVKPLWKTLYRLPKKLKTELPCDPEIPLQGIHQRNISQVMIKISALPCFFIALFTVVKLWTLPCSPQLMNELRKCGIYKQWNFIHSLK